MWKRIWPHETSEGHPNVLERVSKAISKTAVYIKENSKKCHVFSNNIWPEIKSARDRIMLQPLIYLAINFQAQCLNGFPLTNVWKKL